MGDFGKREGQRTFWRRAALQAAFVGIFEMPGQFSDHFLFALWGDT
ncbi:MAG: hypothetical protein HY234_16080 [Acidobacteria bacterium]|nr:hypothetical protein [Acidobacteriota bacterium]